VIGLDSPFVGHNVSCLQMSPTALWFNWERPMIDDAATVEEERLLLEELYGEIVDTGSGMSFIPLKIQCSDSYCSLRR
jgi:hypothetical protein